MEICNPPYSPFRKGGVYLRNDKPNPPYSPFRKGGVYLCNDKPNSPYSPFRKVGVYLCVMISPIPLTPPFVKGDLEGFLKGCPERSERMG